MNQPLTISLVQTSLHWENKEANRKDLEKKIISVTEHTELVLLPEMFSTGFSMNPAPLAESMEGETVQWMKDIAARKKIVLAGSIIIEEKGKYYNRLLWVLPNGQYGYYDKRHRFAFAGEHDCYTAGDKRLITSLKGWRVNLQVCYDLRFPVWARQSGLPGGDPEYDLLVYVANWPEKRIEAWKTLLRARAIENQCYVAAVNRTGEDGNGIVYPGDSMIVDPLGEVVCTGQEDAVYTYTISRDHLESVRNKFPFLKDADGFRILNN
jgi:predicted amidohydrolase